MTGGKLLAQPDLRLQRGRVSAVMQPMAPVLLTAAARST